MEDANPLLKHQWMYHKDQIPNYWAKILTKHYTAFSRQIREGVVISKMAESTDLIMNSKREITGSRVARKNVCVNGEEFEILWGDKDKLDPKEKKLLSELEEGGEEYLDKDLWEMIVNGGKRKVEATNKEEENQVNNTAEIRSTKRQRLMSEYLVDQQHQVHQVDDDEKVQAEIGGLKDKMMEENMVRRGARALERSLKNRKKARDKFWSYTNHYRHLASIGDKGMVKAWSKANRTRENWVKPDMLQVIPEEEEPPEEKPPAPPDETQEIPVEANGDLEHEDGEQEAKNPHGPPRPSQKAHRLFQQNWGPSNTKSPQNSTEDCSYPQDPWKQEDTRSWRSNQTKKEKGED